MHCYHGSTFVVWLKLLQDESSCAKKKQKKQMMKKEDGTGGVNKSSGNAVDKNT